MSLLFKGVVGEITEISDPDERKMSSSSVEVTMNDVSWRKWARVVAYVDLFLEFCTLFSLFTFLILVATRHFDFYVSHPDRLLVESLVGLCGVLLCVSLPIIVMTGEFAATTASDADPEAAKEAALSWRDTQLVLQFLGMAFLLLLGSLHDILHIAIFGLVIKIPGIYVALKYIHELNEIIIQSDPDKAVACITDRLKEINESLAREELPVRQVERCIQILEHYK